MPRRAIILPVAAAVVLIPYAFVYSVLLLNVQSAVISKDVFAWLLIFLLLGLAATPVLALIHLPKHNKGPIGRRALWMTGVMACPALFWTSVSVAMFVNTGVPNFWELFLVFGIVGVPAVLSIYLCVVFARTAMKEHHCTV